MTNCTQISTSSFNIFQYNMKTVLVDTIYYVHIDVWEFRRIRCDINIPVHWPFFQEIFFGKHFYCNQSLWQYLILDVTTTHLASWHIWYWTDSSSSVLLSLRKWKRFVGQFWARYFHLSMPMPLQPILWNENF